MKDNILYLSASLPTLKWLEPPPLRFSVFLERTARLLSHEEHAVLKWAGAPFILQHPLVETWKNFEKTLRTKAESFRLHRFNPEIRVVVAFETTFFQLKNPLQREKWMDLKRFQKAEAIKVSGALSHLFGYGLQLSLLTRYAELNAEAGKNAVIAQLTAWNPALAISGGSHE